MEVWLAKVRNRSRQQDTLLMTIMMTDCPRIVSLTTPRVSSRPGRSAYDHLSTDINTYSGEENDSQLVDEFVRGIGNLTFFF